MNDLDLRTALHRDADLVGEPPADLLDQLGRRRQRQRRQRIALVSAVAAVVVIAAGVPVGVSLAARSHAAPATDGTTPPDLPPAIAPYSPPPATAAPTTAASPTTAAPTPAPATDSSTVTVDPAPVSPDVHTVRFDGIGALHVGMTTADLEALGYSDQGNTYQGPGAACVRFAMDGSSLSARVDSATGTVLAIENFGGDSLLHTQIGDIHAGSSLVQVRAAFDEPGYQIVEKLHGDFGQGGNGVIVTGPGGAIGLGLDGSTVSWVAGVGTPGNAPTAEETGC